MSKKASHIIDGSKSIIRSSKHSISKFANAQKQTAIHELLDIYRSVLEQYISMIASGDLPLRNNLSSKLLPDVGIVHSRYKQLIYKHAGEIIRSQVAKVKKERHRKFKRVYSYFKLRNRQQPFLDKRFSQLNLKDPRTHKSFVLPEIDRITISLDERFFDIHDTSTFDGFVKVILPRFNAKGTRALSVKLPLQHHKHSRGLMNDGFEQRKCVQIKQIGSSCYMNMIWEREFESCKQSDVMGIDVGFRRLIATSKGQVLGLEMVEIYKEMVGKVKGSAGYKKCAAKRSNLLRRLVNEIDFEGVGRVVIEDLTNLNKRKSEYGHKTKEQMSRWTYRPLLDCIKMTCEVNGIELVKVSPSYTSQTCSSCGCIEKESRVRDEFKCVECGYEDDADINAAKNICNKGVIVPLREKEWIS